MIELFFFWWGRKEKIGFLYTAISWGPNYGPPRRCLNSSRLLRAGPTRKNKPSALRRGSRLLTAGVISYYRLHRPSTIVYHTVNPSPGLAATGEGVRPTTKANLPSRIWSRICTSLRVILPFWAYMTNNGTVEGKLLEN